MLPRHAGLRMLGQWLSISLAIPPIAPVKSRPATSSGSPILQVRSSQSAADCASTRMLQVQQARSLFHFAPCVRGSDPAGLTRWRSLSNQFVARYSPGCMYHARHCGSAPSKKARRDLEVTPRSQRQDYEGAWQHAGAGGIDDAIEHAQRRVSIHPMERAAHDDEQERTVPDPEVVGAAFDETERHAARCRVPGGGMSGSGSMAVTAHPRRAKATASGPGPQPRSSTRPPRARSQRSVMKAMSASG
jgi:hypothetical protein